MYVIIPYKEYREAFYRWPITDNLRRTWYAYLQCGVEDVNWHILNESLRVTEEQARRIRLLLGPHYKTIIKAWEINNGQGQARDDTESVG